MEYLKIRSSIGSSTSLDEMIRTHKKLIGKSYKDEYRDIKDCGIDYVEKLFDLEFGRTIVYEFSPCAKAFIFSKYLSDYFKDGIRELLKGEKLDKVVTNAINSDRSFNDMSEEEITKINSAIRDFYRKNEVDKPNIAGDIYAYLFKLDGIGPIRFIKNNTDNDRLARAILLTSGLNDRASFYAGRGVNFGDLNERNLVAIFYKLLKLDKNYATEYAEMVKQMKTLGATEFINSFIKFAHKGFTTKGLVTSDDNISLDGAYGVERDLIAFAAIFATMGIGNDSNWQISETARMKNAFFSMISNVMRGIKPDFNYTPENEHKPMKR